uniref:2-oxoglutarate-dependent ethylene/succinate-forming enzyme n=1 Tax=Candidatus Kentrum sp. TUN TaxID=2126343 RepID=A0A450ZNI0_9GAMM|nr:MAG: Isopenicillin N synthase [Candidatus Kentron sp. TUN]
MSDLKTFYLPESVNGTALDIDLARKMIQAWRTDGAFQVAMTKIQREKSENAFAVNKWFFHMPNEFKSQFINDITYSGYTASGEELTADEKDYSEVFSIFKDIPIDDVRTQAHWPCHGPVPWPNVEYKKSIQAYMDELNSLGNDLLKLIALGLKLDNIDALTNLAKDGWCHIRALRYPEISQESERGIGSHTDYGLLVIINQNGVDGLYIRPPIEGESRNRNWLSTESTAGLYENEEPWIPVKPVSGVFIVLPGDIMQFITSSYLISTLHKIKLNTMERFSMAYFHDPDFNSCVRPLGNSEEYIFYGEYFTKIVMKSYPERDVTRRIMNENRLSVLATLKDKKHGCY